MSNIITINEFGALNLSKIKDAALKRESESLSALQDRIASGIISAVSGVETIRREQAVILNRIQSNKLYAKDGFKSLADYAETIGLGKANAHALANAGKVYSDEKAPDALKAMTPSNLAALNSAINSNKERVYTDAKSGVLDGKTQKQLKDYAAAVNEGGKGRVTKTYEPYVRSAGGLAPLLDEDENGEKKHNRDTGGGWLDYYKSAYGDAQFVKPDKDGNKRILATYPDGEYAALVTLIEYKPGKAKTIAGKAEFLARATAENMSDEQINQVLKIMGWNK